MSQPNDVQEVLDERGGRYGSFVDNSLIAQSLKEVMRGSAHWGQLRSDQAECLDVLASKISRILTGNVSYYDNWLDMQGYLKLVCDRMAEEARKNDAKMDAAQ